MAKAFRMLLLLGLLGATTACRQAVRVVLYAQSGAALTQSSFRSADVVPPKKTVAVKPAQSLALRPAARGEGARRADEGRIARFAMTITVTPCSAQSAPVTRRS